LHYASQIAKNGNMRSDFKTPTFVKLIVFQTLGTK